MLRFFAKAALALLPLSAMAQEAVLNSPLWANRTYFNSAYVGYQEGEAQTNAFLTSKKLWLGIQGSPIVVGFSADHRANEKNAVGIQVWQHRYATLSYSSLSIPYAFNARFDDEQGVLLGLASTLTATSIDLSKITTPELLDIPPQIPTVVFMDASFGAAYYFKDVFRMGVFANNFMFNTKADPDKIINYTNYSLATLGADVGYYIQGQNPNDLKIYFDAYVKGNSITPWIGEASARVGKFGAFVGLGYRTNKDLNILVQIGHNQAMEIGYFYTHSYSDIQKYSDGSHQLFLKYNLVN
jgi:type IX secretion system PorP/SprF family membrane protein